MGEIIEIKLDSRLEGRWLWSATNGLPHKGSGELHLRDLQTGDRLVVEVTPKKAKWEIERVVRHPTWNPSVPPRVSSVPPAQRSHASRELSFTPGDVVVRRIRFSSDSGQDRQGKARPCVVLEISGNEMRVRAIHGSNSAVRREGFGRRVLDWQRAGLNKPSVVAAEDLWLPLNGFSPIGKLSETDRRRIISTDR